jgi:hypothetical protein
VEHALTRNNALGGGGSSGLLVAAVRALRALGAARSLSTNEQRIKATIEEAAFAIGAPLLDADSLDDLGRRLDASLENKNLATHFNGLAQALIADDSLAEQIRSADEGSTEWLIDILGEGQRELASEAERLMRAMATAFENLRRTLQFAFSFDISQSVLLNEDDPLAFLTDRDVPPQIASVVLGTCYANVCLLAITSAALAGRKLPPWLARAIAERWVQGLRGQLALMASFPGTHVEEALVPRAQRFDLEVLVREHTETNAAIDQFHRDADAADVDVYVPDPPR